MSTILDIDTPTVDRGLCAICAERFRALPKVAQCWVCRKAAVDRQHRAEREEARRRQQAFEGSIIADVGAQQEKAQ